MMAWTTLVASILLAVTSTEAGPPSMLVTLTRAAEAPSSQTSVGDDLKLVCRVQWAKSSLAVIWKWMPPSSSQSILLHPVPELFSQSGPMFVKYSVVKDDDAPDDQKFTLTVGRVEYEDDGVYMCVAVTDLRNDSDTYTVAMHGPPAIHSHEDVHRGVSGYDATTTVHFIARPLVTNITWYGPGDDQLNFTSSNVTRYVETVSIKSAMGLVKLTIKNFTDEDEGRYRVVLANEKGVAEATVQFSASPFVDMVTPNSSTTFPFGSTAVFACRAYNFKHSPTFSWHHIGSSLEMTRLDVSGSTTIAINTSYTGMSTATIRGVTYDIIGILVCQASEMGVGYNDTKIIDVIGPPVIQSSTRTVRGAVGEEIELVCNITSNPPPTRLKWLFDGTTLSLQEYADQTLATETNIVMRHVVEVTSQDDYGNYMCQVANKYGTIGHSINLVGTSHNEQLPCPETPCTEGKVCVEEEGKCVCPHGYYETKKGDCVVSSISYSQDKDNEDYVWVGVGAGSVLVITLVMGLVLYICWKKRGAFTRRDKTEQMGHLNAAYTHAQYATANIYEVITRPSDEFPRERLRLQHPLGIGKFGRVMKGEALSINRTGRWEEVAIKMCQESATDLDKEDLYNELDIIRKIPKHINVVSFYGACTYGEPLLLILEYVPFGDLRNYLRRKRPLTDKNIDSPASEGESPLEAEVQHHGIDEGELTAKDLLSFALQSAKGMNHLESNNIVHRDVAARNVLIGYNGVCKISDFGLARDVEGVDVYERTSKGPLPIRWMSPEALIEGSHSHKADVWAFGILLWEIVTLGASPYSTLTLRSVIDAVVTGKRLERPQHCVDELYSLMGQCWEHLPKDRPTFSSMCRELEFLLEKEADYIQLDQFQEAVYMVLEPDSTEEKL